MIIKNSMEKHSMPGTNKNKNKKNKNLTIRNQFGMVPVKILSTELNKFVRRFGTLIGEVFGPRKDAEGGRFRHRNLTPTGEVLGPRNGRRR